MGRKKIPKQIIYNTFYRLDNPNRIGHCWHCGKRIYFKNRSSQKKNGAWQIDHHPIPYRDIEDQVLIGIINPNYEKNLVSACLECNLSHKYENSKIYYCNNSQFPCKKKFIKKICIIIIIIYSLIISLFFIKYNYF